MRSLLPAIALAVLASAATAQVRSGPLRGLPVREFPPRSEAVGGIIFLSGDGGWRSFDRANSDSLPGMGWFVLGIDDLALFYHEMSGDSLTLVLRTMIDYVRAKIPAGSPVYVAGYSFGAELAADALARGVPADGLYLLGPGERGIRKITLGGYLFREPRGLTSFDVAERLNARGCVPIAFLTGENDTAGEGAHVFPKVRQPAAQFIVPGASHHYHGGDIRYTRIARQAFEWLNAHRGSCP
jgi:hypothetical protein